MVGSRVAIRIPPTICAVGPARIRVNESFSRAFAQHGIVHTRFTPAPGRESLRARELGPTRAARLLPHRGVTGGALFRGALVSTRALAYIAGMPERSRIVTPGPRAGTVRTLEQEVLTIPSGWALLAPGDAGVTRRVKKAGPTWTVQEKRGRKTFSLGLWAPAETIEQMRKEMELERQKPSYARKLEAGRARRAAEQEVYSQDFTEAVRSFLAFAPRHDALAEALASAIAAHAVPVGSGTVARTERIPIERRAEAATIAWLRHATTEYDHMHIPRVRGMRREVRRMLAERSRELLARYRRGEAVPLERCPLRKALGRAPGSAAQPLSEVPGLTE